MYLAYNEGKSVIAARFLRTLKSKIFKKIASFDSNSYFHYLHGLVDDYDNTYHCSVGKKPVNTGNSALHKETESNNIVPKFSVGDGVRITKYKNIFSKSYTENWSREIFSIDTMLITNPLTHAIKDLNGEKLFGSFFEK